MTKQIDFAGIHLNPMSLAEFLDCVETAHRHGDSPRVIAHHNLHSLYLLRRHQGMQAFYERADFSYMDGMPLLVIAKAFGHSVSPSRRLTCLDYLPHLIHLAATRGWSIFFLGGHHGSVEKGWAYPSLRSLQFHHRDGYFDTRPGSRGNRDVLADIEREAPDVLLVGMGMPRQEQWILDNLDRINARVIITIGACLDYGSGRRPIPPRWMGRLGLEWLFRLAHEPCRLGNRYLLEPWAVVWDLYPHAVRHKRNLRSFSRRR